MLSVHTTYILYMDNKIIKKKTKKKTMDQLLMKKKKIIHKIILKILNRCMK